MQNVAAIRQIMLVGGKNLQRDGSVVAASFERRDGRPDIYIAGAEGQMQILMSSPIVVQVHVGQPAAKWLCYRYGVEERGNVREDPHSEFTGKNILYQAHSVEETAQQ